MIFPVKLSHIAFETQLGWMGVSSSEAGLMRVILPQDSPEKVLHFLSRFVEQTFSLTMGRAKPTCHISEGAFDEGFEVSSFGDLPGRLRRYLSGEIVSFSDKLDLAGATSFQRMVWQAVQAIPYGEIRSYAWVASRLEKPRAFRAVGQALARNPLPIVIPCHRVIGSNGNLGGFSGGCELKRHLLQTEAKARG